LVALYQLHFGHSGNTLYRGAAANLVPLYGDPIVVTGITKKPKAFRKPNGSVVVIIAVLQAYVVYPSILAEMLSS
jgi:hypothetical protein